MKAEELQIGDWVKLCNKKGEWLDNSQVDLNLLNRQAEDIVVFEPIPITPEFLEKNGFRKTKGYATTTYEWTIMDGVTIYINIFEDNDIIVGIETKPKKGIGVNRLHHCEIKYVHQLQQAMRLCGINKEIIVEDKK